MSIPLNKPGFELMIDLINLSNNTKFTPADLTVTEIQPLDDPLYPNYNTTAVARGTGTTTFKGPKPVRFRRLDLEVLTGGRSRHFDFPERETPYTMEEVLVSVNNRFNIQLVAGVDVDDVPVPVGANAALPLTVLPDSYVYNGGVELTVTTGASEPEAPSEWQIFDVADESARVAGKYVLSTGGTRVFLLYDATSSTPFDSVASFPVESDMWSLSYHGGRYGAVAFGYDTGQQDRIVATYPIQGMLEEPVQFHRQTVELPGVPDGGIHTIFAHPVLDAIFLVWHGTNDVPARIYTRSFTNTGDAWTLYKDFGDAEIYGKTQDQSWTASQSNVGVVHMDDYTGAIGISFRDGVDNGTLYMEIETIDLQTTETDFELKPAVATPLFYRDFEYFMYSKIVKEPWDNNRLLTAASAPATYMYCVMGGDVINATGVPAGNAGYGIPSAVYGGTAAGYQEYINDNLSTVLLPEPRCTSGPDGGIKEQPINHYTNAGVIETGLMTRGGNWYGPLVFPDQRLIYARYNEVCNPH